MGIEDPSGMCMSILPLTPSVTIFKERFNLAHDPELFFAEAKEGIEYARQNLKDIAGIYAYVSLVNGQIYIGKSVNLARRIPHHLHSKTNTYFWNSLLKYGVNNFSLIIIQTFDKEDLNLFIDYMGLMEFYYINTCDFVLNSIKMLHLLRIETLFSVKNIQKKLNY